METEKLYLSVDAGGTAIKVAVFDEAGHERAVQGVTVDPSREKPGWVERDLGHMWELTCGLIQKVLLDLRSEANLIAAIGLTGFGNGLIALDEAGDPVRNCILSSDSRAQEFVGSWIDAGLEADHVSLTGQKLWPGKPLPLLAWMRKMEPENYRKTAYVLPCKDYLRFKLTSQLSTEIGEASSASYLDIEERRISQQVLEILDLTEVWEKLPPLIETLSLAGSVSEMAARETGLRAGTPVSAGFTDGPCMMFGMGAHRPGDIGVIAGTWGLNQKMSRQIVKDGSILASMAGPTAREFVLVEGSPNSASVLQWFLDQNIRPVLDAFGVKKLTNEMLLEWCNDVAAGHIGRTGLPLFCPNVNGSFDGAIDCGAFHGIKSWHNVEHMTYAVMEGIAFEHQVQLQRLSAGEKPPEKYFLGGGAARSSLWPQIFANVLGASVQLSKASELGALGAAIVAAVACGHYPDLNTAVGAMVQPGILLDPDPPSAKIAQARYGLYKKFRLGMSA